MVYQLTCEPLPSVTFPFPFSYLPLFSSPQLSSSQPPLTVHRRPGFIAPKKAYSFDLMLDDILSFAVTTLIDGGRLSMWMPTANDEDIEHAIPQHQALKLVACCIQNFNKWSRRLLTYVRLSDEEAGELVPRVRREVLGRKADELNSFRRKVSSLVALPSVAGSELTKSSTLKGFKKWVMGRRDRTPNHHQLFCK